MADLFVSYSREDKARAEEIVRLLEDYGWDVFWDQETRAGTLWPKVLEEELIKARCLVALWTTTSIASRWVRIEAYEALQNEKLVPVLLDKVRPPLEFRQTQTFDLIGWNGDRQDARLAHLLADLTALAKAPGSHGGTARPIKLVVPPTLQREKPATVKTPPSVPDAELAMMDSPLAGSGRSVASSHVGPSKITSSRGLMLGLGLTAAVGVVAGFSMFYLSRPAKSVATTPSAPSTTVAVPAPPEPAPPEPQPAKTTTETTTVVAGPLPAPQVPKAATKQPSQKLRSSRCRDIEEKFQQTGQITAADQKVLLSKECQ